MKVILTLRTESEPVNETTVEVIEPKQEIISQEVFQSTQNFDTSVVPPFAPDLTVSTVYDEPSQTQARAKSLPFSLDIMKENIKAENSLPKFSGRGFTAELTDTKGAEAELTRKFNKSSFEKLEIIGQFNKGFIIAKLGDDLFIIDQHASDEKYNFERLMSQKPPMEKMLVPKKLNLNPGDVQILLEKRHIFESVGFKFNFPSENSHVKDERVELVEGNRWIDRYVSCIKVLVLA